MIALERHVNDSMATMTALTIPISVFESDSDSLPVNPITAINVCGIPYLDDVQLFSGKSQRADIVRYYPELDNLCDRWGFGWHGTIAEWSDAPPRHFLELARAARPARAHALQEWGLLSMAELIADVIVIHHRPMSCELQRIGILVDHLNDVHGDLLFRTMGTSIQMLRRMVHILHLQEEIEVFPLCLGLESALLERISWSGADAATSLRCMAQGHIDMKRELVRLAAVVEKASRIYLDLDLFLVSDAITIMTANFLAHIAVEDSILIPHAIAAQEQLLARDPSDLQSINKFES
jgi:iron-sulfur cluster repair protein YtfE (RIC family)